MRRLLAVAAVAVALPAAAGGATGTYSSGNLHAAIPANATLEHAVTVPESGPVAHAVVWVRLDHPRDRDLTLSLVSPSGTAIPLAAKRGKGRNFGTGARSCGGDAVVFADDAETPISDGDSPFDEGPYRPEQPLARLKREPARGKWTLRIENAGASTGTLYCWVLELSRDVREVHRRRLGAVSAELSFREDFDVFRDVRFRIVRAGRVALDRPLRLSRFARPVVPLRVARLDRDAEPEVVLDVYSGGAHCCTTSRVYRYVAPTRSYVVSAHAWGNVGYRLHDIDRDGAPEFDSYDDRFNYVFTAYVASFPPPQYWNYDRGRFVNVTRGFTGLLAIDAARRLRMSGQLRRQKIDVRGLLAGYMADEALLGREAEGWRRLEAAFRRGDLYRTGTRFGYPAGRRYLAALRAFLRKTGYLR